MFRTSIPVRRVFTSALRYGPIKNRIESKLQDSLKFAPRIRPSEPRRVCVLGGGSFGTAIANLVAENTVKFNDFFRPEVVLYLRNVPLSKELQTKRRNEKYLPGIDLAENLEVHNSLTDCLSTSNVIIFAVPNEFITDVCQQIVAIRASLPKNTVGISLIKGLSFDSSGNFERITEVIQRITNIPTGVLSGANVALEVAQKQYCEAVLCPPQPEDCLDSSDTQDYLCKLFTTDYFKITPSHDQATVEFCGALKNVIACGAGLIDGLGYGINTKSAAIAAGTREMIKFIELFHPNFQLQTLFDSCGVADIVASSFGGRNRRVAEAFVKRREREDLEQIEARLLQGQKLQGVSTARCVYDVLKKAHLLDEFPVFTTIHRIFNEHHNPATFIDAIRQPSFLSVRNESYMHNVPKDAETHFRVVIVSQDFHGINTLKRHQLVNKCLADQFSTFHALALETYSPEQWSKLGEESDLTSPNCRGGSKL